MLNATDYPERPPAADKHFREGMTMSEIELSGPAWPPFQPK